MRIAELMTSAVLCVEEDTPLLRVAQLIAEHGISAVPVVRQGEPVGIISESDLVADRRSAPGQRRSWLRLLLARGMHHSAPVFDTGSYEGRTAGEVMSTPLITISESANVKEAIALMQAERIKRLPVVRGGRIVGILSRADLLRGFAGLDGPRGDSGFDPFMGVDRDFAAAGSEPQPPASPPPAPATPTLTAADFRQSVVAAQEHAHEALRHARIEARERHRHDVEEARAAHISESFWRGMLLNARHAAERGELELMILRFPREVCGDAGRMIDNGEAGWETTLHGEAADVFRRWALELKPRGFHLRARTLDYPGGLPGDIGLFLSWGA